MIFHKPAGGESAYVLFGYGQQQNCNHTWVQVSGSMNAYPVNLK